MPRYLTIDCGNTSTKLLLWSARGDALWRETTLHRNGAALAMPTDVTAVAISAVAPLPAWLQKWLAAQTCPVTMLDTETPTPLSGIRYNCTLGPDRLAAAVGAYTLSGGGVPLLVADPGTALTIDSVTADGIFEGGIISPGLGLRLDSLSHATARLPQVMPHILTADADPLGHDTVDAILRGCLQGLAAEILYYARPGVQIYLTGADAPLLLPLLEQRGLTAHCDALLVQRGLFTILTYDTCSPFATSSSPSVPR